jgi:hypothetical protein
MDVFAIQCKDFSKPAALLIWRQDHPLASDGQKF